MDQSGSHNGLSPANLKTIYDHVMKITVLGSGVSILEFLVGIPPYVTLITFGVIEGSGLVAIWLLLQIPPREIIKIPRREFKLF